MDAATHDGYVVYSGVVICLRGGFGGCFIARIRMIGWPGSFAGTCVGHLLGERYCAGHGRLGHRMPCWRAW